MDVRRGYSAPRGGDGRWAVSPGLDRLSYLTFLMAMMKKQPMMAIAMATGKAKL